jgi:hypothetical protein
MCVPPALPARKCSANNTFIKVAEHTGSLFQTVQNGPGVHPGFYSMGDKGSFLESKAAGTLR